MLFQCAWIALMGVALLEGQTAANPDAAGIPPHSSVSQAQQAAADAQDAELLARMLGVSDLTEEQAAQLQEAASRRVERATAAVQKMQRMVDAGLMPAQSLKEPLQAQAWAQDDAGIARARAELVRAVGEMARAEELAAEIPKDKDPGNPDRPAMERFDGGGIFTRSEFNQIKQAFENQFGKPLPVSADGDTAVHRAMGFDHSNRVDVALVPDTPEGVWLRHFLEMSSIPFYAFRTSIPGKATGAHIHIGLPSNHIATRAGAALPAPAHSHS